MKDNEFSPKLPNAFRYNDFMFCGTQAEATILHFFQSLLRLEISEFDDLKDSEFTFGIRLTIMQHCRVHTLQYYPPTVPNYIQVAIRVFKFIVNVYIRRAFLFFMERHIKKC